MTPRDDLIAALERRQPAGAVPVWELEFQAWDTASGKHVVLGHEFASLSRGEQERALVDNAEIMLRVSQEMHYAAVTAPNAYWEIAPGVAAYYWLPEEFRFRQMEVLHKLAPADLMLVAGIGGVLAMPAANEYVEFSYKLYDAPEEIDERAHASLERGLDQAKRVRDCGIEIAETSSDIADNHGPFFKPVQMERFILPYLRRWAEACRNMGLYTVMHSDGDLAPCLDGIAASGVHALQAIDPIAGMDLLATKQRVGDRLCLCGNIDCGLLVSGSPDEVYAETRERLLTCKAGGGLVLGASNAVQPEVPIENYCAMLAAWRDHGQYGADNSAADSGLTGRGSDAAAKATLSCVGRGSSHD